MRFWPPPKRAAARAKLQAAGIDPQQPYAILAPTNEFYTKRWLPERYAAIAEELAQRGLQIVLTGAPTTEQMAQVASVQAATKQKLAALEAQALRAMERLGPDWTEDSVAGFSVTPEWVDQARAWAASLAGYWREISEARSNWERAATERERLEQALAETIEWYEKLERKPALTAR